MLQLTNIDLRNDPEARTFVKNEVVDVVFAVEKGELISLEGPNRYQVRDAILTAANGARWVVSRNRFDEKYLPEANLAHGNNGLYRNKPVPVLAKQMPEAFTLQRSTGSDFLIGKSGDWVMQYAFGDYGITENARFQSVYRPYPND
jgi:hypothetical protein